MAAVSGFPQAVWNDASDFILFECLDNQKKLKDVQQVELRPTIGVMMHKVVTDRCTSKNGFSSQRGDADACQKEWNKLVPVATFAKAKAGK